MDALLKYLLYNITYTVLSIEILIILGCVLAIIMIKIFTKWLHYRTERIQNQLTLIFETSLFNKRPVKEINIPASFRQFRNLVEVLEEFDQRFDDSRWSEVKEFVVSHYLLQRAKRYASSSYWYKRQLAVRSYLLCPQKVEENLLFKLLKDKRYLVRIPAAVCITKTHYQNLFYEMIKQMSEEPQLSQFPYRDALMQTDQEKYEWMESLLKSESNDAIIAICLDVLSTRYSHNLFPYAISFLNSPSRDCRIKAIAALGNIPNNESVKLLNQYLEDSDFKIRELSIVGLEKLYAIKAAPRIGGLLNDSVWSVRLQAALTLKNFGKPGMDILDVQSKDQSPKAYEIAQYVLSLPS